MVPVALVPVKAIGADAASPVSATAALVSNGGFEAGLSQPWGSGLAAASARVWTNEGHCRSTAEADANIQMSGKRSLHIVNPGPTADGDMGRMQQTLHLTPNQRYRVLLWARAKALEFDGAVVLLLEKPSLTYPPIVRLDRGTYDWTPFTGAFVAPDAEIDLCIISVGSGEAWIDDLVVEPEADSLSPPPAR